MADENSTKWMPTAGGVLDILAAVGGFFGSAFLGFLGVVVRRAGFDSGAFRDFPRLESLPSALFWFGAFFVLLLSVFSLIGGISAIQRKSWGLALAGSICAIFQSTIIGILATVFVGMSRKEFKN